MSDTTNLQGGCLCGAVKIKLDEVKTEVGVCHCSMCRKWAGGPFMGIDAEQKVQISGEENISTYNSSDWAERAFCKQCGTNLYYRLKQNNGYHVLAGMFDAEQLTQAGVKLGGQIFIDEKPAFYNFAEDTPKMTGAEVMAMFASADDS